MEKKIYLTMVKNDHKLSGNAFVRGKITGIRYALLHKDLSVDMANAQMPDGTVIIPAECTTEEYETFKLLVEKCYPDLCIFDYKVPVEN